VRVWGLKMPHSVRPPPLQAMGPPLLCCRGWHNFQTPYPHLELRPVTMPRVTQIRRGLLPTNLPLSHNRFPRRGWHSLRDPDLLRERKTAGTGGFTWLTCPGTTCLPLWCGWTARKERISGRWRATWAKPWAAAPSSAASAVPATAAYPSPTPSPSTTPSPSFNSPLSSTIISIPDRPSSPIPSTNHLYLCFFLP